MRPSRKQALIGIVIGVLAAANAHAQRSRRVIRQDSLTVQKSMEVGTKVDAPVATTGVTQGEGKTDTVALPIGWQPKPIHAVTGVTGVTAITGSTGQKTNPLQNFLQGLGNGGGGGNGAGAASGSNGTANNSGNATNPGSNTGSTPSNASQSAARDPNYTPGNNRQDAVDPGKPLPEDTSVKDRDCSATRKTWQPPTKQPFKLNSCYGNRGSKHGRHHNGLDFGILKQPQSINPVAPGRIKRAGMRGGYGCEIVIEHDSCPAAVGGNKCYSQYAHLKKDKNGSCPAVGREGQSVTACTEIAMMGNTGASDGPHLHFEVRTGVEAPSSVDPVTKFREWQAHANYDRSQSSCGSVGDGVAPPKIVPHSARGRQ